MSNIIVLKILLLVLESRIEIEAKKEDSYLRRMRVREERIIEGRKESKKNRKIF